MHYTLDQLRAWILTHDVQDARIIGDEIRIAFWAKDYVQDCWVTQFDYARNIRDARRALGY